MLDGQEIALRARECGRDARVLVVSAHQRGELVVSQLHIAVPTVKAHIHDLYGKLGVCHRGAAPPEGMRRGLLD